ncbi:c-type cytochrome [Candidatus Pantoea persica]|uniref:c-type cytochrome n=1 Tax=Candidatus Pantoea persica TaxID=2518128 RepID=UPI00215D9691|nr:cytochrome c [Candidatus Pantoea persica]MBA2814696.1 D-alanyl-D-alanine carboxypeptidase DacD precursor [Candidatus Pantoea persica]
MVSAGSRGVYTDACPTAPEMPPFAGVLDDEQIADALIYVRNSWGNAAAPVSTSDVKEVKEEVKSVRQAARRPPAAI